MIKIIVDKQYTYPNVKMHVFETNHNLEIQLFFKSKETQKKFEECEWCFQFDEDEPQIFATADSTTSVPEVVIKLQNTSESHITFSDPAKNKKFRMYARPRS